MQRRAIFFGTTIATLAVGISQAHAAVIGVSSR
jgi:hypothetical protein